MLKDPTQHLCSMFLTLSSTVKFSCGQKHDPTLLTRYRQRNLTHVTQTKKNKRINNRTLTPLDRVGIPGYISKESGKQLVWSN